MKFVAAVVLLAGLGLLYVWESIPKPPDLPFTKNTTTSNAPDLPDARQVTTDFSVKIRRIQGAARLVTCVVHESASVKIHQPHWRGDVTVVATCPAKISYGVDLRKLDAMDLNYDEKRQILTVRVPSLLVLGVNVDLEDCRTSYSIGWGRTRARSGEWLGSMARRQLYRTAKKMAMEKDTYSKAKLVSGPMLKEQFERVLQIIVSRAVVVVHWKRPKSKQ